jgi:hypothetical protein
VINFRYHVVSLTAVFLALAIGLVVGTAALNGPAADVLEDTVNGLRKANGQYRAQVDSLTDQVDKESQFVSQAAPLLLANRLAGKRVLVVSFAHGSEHVDGVKSMLTLAGATITGTVALHDKFANPDNSYELLGLENDVQPGSVPVAAIPTSTDGIETSSALLAAVLLDRVPPVPAADTKAVLTAYSQAGYIGVDGGVTGPAEMVVFVSGMADTDSKAGGKNAAVVTTVVQFDKQGVAMVAGLGSGEGNLVSEIRDDAVLVKSISTVDDSSTVQGQVATALAAEELLVKNKVGHYGVEPNSTGLVPQDKK